MTVIKKIYFIIYFLTLIFVFSFVISCSVASEVLITTENTEEEIHKSEEPEIIENGPDVIVVEEENIGEYEELNSNIIEVKCIRVADGDTI